MKQHCWKCGKELYMGDGCYGACLACTKVILKKEEKKIRSTSTSKQHRIRSN